MQYIRKGEYNSFMFEIENCDGSAYDLADARIKFIVKKSAGHEDSTVVLSGEIENSETNKVMFDFTAQQTADLIVGNYVMALKVFRNSGVNFELWSDNCKIVKGVFDD